ncbi:MAG: type II/IV secretion system protein [Candidatus Omnitrophota bacterium]|nr:MAG: type II/IV secretion system protein [Candidatus Omnitrophota bacterium]
MKRAEDILKKVLIDRGLIKEEDWAKVREEANKAENLILGLAQQGLISEKEALQILAQQLHLQYSDLKNVTIDKRVLDKVPVRIAFYYKFLPLKVEERDLTLAVSFPLDIKIQDEIRTHLGYNIKVVLASRGEILEALKRFYGVGAETLERISISSQEEAKPELEEVEKIEEIESLAEDASVIRLVNEIISDAYKKRATDIHLEPYRGEVAVRYRIDGILYDIKTSSQIKDFFSAIISRIKIMANLNIVERRLPQDGRAIVKVQDEALDLRISTMPTPYGESVVIRILPTKMLFNLEKLGLSKRDLDILEGLIRKPYGIIFVTGPTGSGKTTTLYACLNRINTRDKKIITLEDPIEYEIKGITQVQVNPSIGLDFARGLRSILRHDPDIIMVGEVRDLETAEIAIRVALTGHLIFSTLHTNDAPSGITRLIDIGIEPYLISSSVEAFIAQRLVRVICPYCKEEDNSQSSLKEAIVKDLNLSSAEEVKIFRGKGCDNCNYTGFFGRTAIYEILLVDEVIKGLILKKVSANEIKKVAIERGMHTLIQDGWQKVIQGITTPQEVLRVVSIGELGGGELDKNIFREEIKFLGRKAEENKEETSNSTEKRIYPRLDKKLNVKYKVIKSEKKDIAEEKLTLTENISAGGIAFLALEELNRGSLIEVEIDLMDGQPPIQCLSRVIWTKRLDSGEYEVGICFLDLTTGERARLKRYTQQI